MAASPTSAARPDGAAAISSSSAASDSPTDDLPQRTIPSAVQEIRRGTGVQQFGQPSHRRLHPAEAARLGHALLVHVKVAVYLVLPRMLAAIAPNVRLGGVAENGRASCRERWCQ